jgi:putative membrane protein
MTTTTLRLPEQAAPDVGLDAAARTRVDAAISAAEAGTSAELVVGVTAKSGRYLHTVYEAGLIGIVVAVALFAAGWWLAYRTWPVIAIDVFAGVVAAGFILGALVARSEGVARFLAGDDVMLDACERRAREVFAAHGVSRTRERNGVLLFASLFEHVVLVCGDDGVTTKLGKDAYREVVESVIARLRTGAVEAGLTDGVVRLGRLLAPAFPRAADDVNELPDRLYVV